MTFSVNEEEPNAKAPDDSNAHSEYELPDFSENDAEQVIILEEAANGAEKDDDDGTPNNVTEHIDEEQNNTTEEDPVPQAEHPINDDAILVLREHSSETLAIAASPTNRNLLITGGMDDVGLIWDLELQSSIAKVDGGKESVSSVAFSHDGKYAALGSENGAISIVYMDGTIAPGKPLDGPGDAIHFLSWHPRGPVLLAGSADNVAYMWNVAKFQFMTAFAGHEDAVTCGEFSSDGKLVITGSPDCSVRVWSPTTGETLVRIQTGIAGLRGVFHGADIHCLSVGSENTTADRLIISGCAAGNVFITHRETGHIVCELPKHEGGVECVSFAPSGMKPLLVASAGADGIIRVWDVERSMERCRLEHEGVISKVLWHPSKPVLFSASSEGSIAVWNVLLGQKICQFTGHEAFITDMCLAGGLSFVASTSGDGTIRLFDIREIVSDL